MKQTKKKLITEILKIIENEQKYILAYKLINGIFCQCYTHEVPEIIKNELDKNDLINLHWYLK